MNRTENSLQCLGAAIGLHRLSFNHLRTQIILPRNGDWENEECNEYGICDFCWRIGPVHVRTSQDV